MQDNRYSLTNYLLLLHRKNVMKAKCTAGSTIGANQAQQLQEGGVGGGGGGGEGSSAVVGGPTGPLPLLSITKPLLAAASD